MAERKSLRMDAHKASSSSISSDEEFLERKASWPLMQIGYYQLLASRETSEQCFSQHFMTVHLSYNHIVKERKLNGRLQ